MKLLPTPVLEIGGTHVTAALVTLDGSDADVPVSLRRPLDSDAPAAVVLDAVAAAALELGVSGAQAPGRWGVAVPGPFDYDTGIGRFAHVGKFDALNGVDVGQELASRLAGDGGRPTFAFLNDAAAFAVGEWRAGAARGASRSVCVTLGTGVGGAFLVGGEPVTSGDEVPPEGVLHLLKHEGRDIEDASSRRALIAAYAAASGVTLDVADIARAAREGDRAAVAVFEGYYGALGDVLAPWLPRFRAEVVVVGGSIARSWDLVERFLVPRLPVPVRPAQLPEAAPLVGAAHHASRAR